jgi:hypothetical protein
MAVAQNGAKGFSKQMATDGHSDQGSVARLGRGGRGWGMVYPETLLMVLLPGRGRGRLAVPVEAESVFDLNLGVA